MIFLQLSNRAAPETIKFGIEIIMSTFVIYKLSAAPTMTTNIQYIVVFIKNNYYDSSCRIP